MQPLLRCMKRDYLESRNTRTARRSIITRATLKNIRIIALTLEFPLYLDNIRVNEIFLKLALPHGQPLPGVQSYLPDPCFLQGHGLLGHQQVHHCQGLPVLGHRENHWVKYRPRLWAVYDTRKFRPSATSYPW